MEGEEAEPMETEAPSQPPEAPISEQWEDTTVTRERAIGTGDAPRPSVVPTGVAWRAPRCVWVLPLRVRLFL